MRTAAVVLGTVDEVVYDTFSGGKCVCSSLKQVSFSFGASGLYRGDSYAEFHTGYGA